VDGAEASDRHHRFGVTLSADEQAFMERRSRTRYLLGSHLMEAFMKLAMIALSTAALIASAPAVFAQGTSANAPGQKMQDKNSTKGGPGAQEYDPGKETQDKSSKSGGEYSPGKPYGSESGGTSGSSSTTTRSK
jgi:hypothetical protein